MPRRPRHAIPGFPHHITQRGNNRQDIFFADEDRELYLALLRQHPLQYGFEVMGYCLMTNHVHIIGVPTEDDSLAKTVGRTHWKYSQVLNRLHGRSGHLWQNRFYSCPMDGAHMVAAMAYIERNPVRAKLVRNAWNYPWSSADAHVGDAGSEWLEMAQWRRASRGLDWKERLKLKEEAGPGTALMLHTNRGRPLGSDAFVAKIEAMVGMRLRALPVGRPKLEKK
jgi:putative transposase